MYITHFALPSPSICRGSALRARKAGLLRAVRASSISEAALFWCPCCARRLVEHARSRAIRIPFAGSHAQWCLCCIASLSRRRVVALGRNPIAVLCGEMLVTLHVGGGLLSLLLESKAQQDKAQHVTLAPCLRMTGLYLDRSLAMFLCLHRMSAGKQMAMCVHLIGSRYPFLRAWSEEDEEDGVHDGCKLAAGSVKVLYNNSKTFKWILPSQFKSMLRVSSRPSAPYALAGQLLKQTHNWITTWHLRHFEVSRGYLQWWATVDDANAGKSDGTWACGGRVARAGSICQRVLSAEVGPYPLGPDAPAQVVNASSILCPTLRHGFGVSPHVGHFSEAGLLVEASGGADLEALVASVIGAFRRSRPAVTVNGIRRWCAAWMASQGVQGGLLSRPLAETSPQRFLSLRNCRE